MTKMLMCAKNIMKQVILYYCDMLKKTSKNGGGEEHLCVENLV